MLRLWPRPPVPPGRSNPTSGPDCARWIPRGRCPGGETVRLYCGPKPNAGCRPTGEVLRELRAGTESRGTPERVSCPYYRAQISSSVEKNKNEEAERRLTWRRARIGEAQAPVCIPRKLGQRDNSNHAGTQRPGAAHVLPGAFSRIEPLRPIHAVQSGAANLAART